MRTEQSEKNFKDTLRKIFGRRRRRRVSLLALNILVFNFRDGWRRTLSRRESARFYA